MRVVFVCTGNICRSPMAEGMCRARLAGRVAAPVDVSSMGTLGLLGEPASRYAQQACLERGIDISAHRSRALDAGELATAELVLTMEPVHAELVAECCPGAAGRTALLGVWPGTGSGLQDDSVPDPMGRPLAYYREVADTIECHVARVVETLVQSDRCQPPST